MTSDSVREDMVALCATYYCCIAAALSGCDLGRILQE